MIYAHTFVLFTFAIVMLSISIYSGFIGSNTHILKLFHWHQVNSMISSSEVILKELCKILRVYFFRDVLCTAVSFRPIQQCIFIIHTTCKLKDYDRNLIADKG